MTGLDCLLELTASREFSCRFCDFSAHRKRQRARMKEKFRSDRRSANSLASPTRNDVNDRSDAPWPAVHCARTIYWTRVLHAPRNGCGGRNPCGESIHGQSIPRLHPNSAPSTYWPRAQARREIRTMLRCTPCSYPPLPPHDCPNPTPGNGVVTNRHTQLAPQPIETSRP